MSKERSEEAKKWIGQMRLILSTKTDKDEIAYVQSKIDLFEWMIEQVEQNKRYREALSLLNRVAAADYKSYIDTDANFVVDVTSEALEESE